MGQINTKGSRFYETRCINRSQLVKVILFPCNYRLVYTSPYKICLQYEQYTWLLRYCSNDKLIWFLQLRWKAVTRRKSREIGPDRKGGRKTQMDPTGRHAYTTSGLHNNRTYIQTANSCHFEKLHFVGWNTSLLFFSSRLFRCLYCWVF